MAESDRSARLLGSVARSLVVRPRRPRPGPDHNGLLIGAQRRGMRELRKFAEIEAEHDADFNAYRTLPELAANMMGYYRWIRRAVGDLTEDQLWMVDPRTKEKIPCPEFELELRLMNTVKGLCEIIIRNDLDARSRHIEEAKLEIIGLALVAAAEDAGLDEQTRSKLGRALREQFQLIQASSEQEAAAV